MLREAEIAEEAARAAGEVLRRWIGRVAVQEKGPADLVTQADLESQHSIQARLLAAFPRHRFLGEESSDNHAWFDRSSGDDRPIWIVDPLDGTTNFVHGLPAYCVSIALWDQLGPRVGVVYDPERDELFRAERGLGAWCNGRRLAVSHCQEVSAALVAAGFGPRVSRTGPEVAQFLNAITTCRAVRRWGSAALNLAYVACGRFDAAWGYSLKPWDAAAGVLLVSEAGGRAAHLEGGPFQIADPRLLAAATPQLEHQLRICLLADVS